MKDEMKHTCTAVTIHSFLRCGPFEPDGVQSHMETMSPGLFFTSSSLGLRRWQGRLQFITSRSHGGRSTVGAGDTHTPQQRGSRKKAAACGASFSAYLLCLPAFLRPSLPRRILPPPLTSPSHSLPAGLVPAEPAISPYLGDVLRSSGSVRGPRPPPPRPPPPEPSRLLLNGSLAGAEEPGGK